MTGEMNKGLNGRVGGGRSSGARKNAAREKHTLLCQHISQHKNEAMHEKVLSRETPGIITFVGFEPSI